MRTREFEIDARAPGPAERVIDFLADLPRQRGLHPFLVSAVVVGQEGGVTQYAVTERPALGPLRYRTRFTAWVRRASPTMLRTEVRVGALVRLEIVTAAEPAGEGSVVRLHEHTVVRAPGPLLGYVTRNAEAAHRRVLDRLPAALGGDDGRRA